MIWRTYVSSLHIGCVDNDSTEVTRGKREGAEAGVLVGCQMTKKMGGWGLDPGTAFISDDGG